MLFRSRYSNGGKYTRDPSRIYVAQPNKFFMKSIANFERLRWFLFDPIEAKFNLSYLASELYDNADGMAASIRTNAEAQFKLHLDETCGLGMFPLITQHIKKTTKIDSVVPAKQVSSLRFKRYRILADI